MEIENKYKGMTVNERLFVSGYMNDFEKAVEEQNTAMAISILKKLAIGEENIPAIIAKHFPPQARK